MENKRSRNLDILCVGELLVDLMTTDYADKLDGNRLFRPVQGGSPANLCLNMVHLGKDARLVSTIGRDDIGEFLLQSLKQQGLNTDLIARVDHPSTLILLTHSLGTPNFEAYRNADQYILPEQLPKETIEQVSIFHTTCFALSKEPARTNILKAAKIASAAGVQLSIDLNYAQKIWPDQAEAQSVVKQYVQNGALVKVSEVDWERLYGTPLKEARDAATHFLNLGAKQVCVTLGSEGALLASKEDTHFLEARAVTVRDTTGAGDAFWSGYLTAFLDRHNLLNCGKAGRRMAELKLGHLGPIQSKVDRKIIYEDFVLDSV